METCQLFSGIGGCFLQIPVLSIAAWSGTGKTTYLEKLVPALRRRGLRIAVVKHDAHGFEVDREGKDSRRMTQAGAEVSAIVSPFGAAVIENRPLTPETLIGRIRDVDLILVEGLKHGPFPKLALLRAGSGKPLPVPEADCLAVVTDAPLRTAKPLLPLNDAEPAADFILNWLRRQASE